MTGEGKPLIQYQDVIYTLDRTVGAICDTYELLSALISAPPSSDQSWLFTIPPSPPHMQHAGGQSMSIHQCKHALTHDNTVSIILMTT